MEKILIVDDEKEVTDLFEDYLIMLGYEVTSLNKSSQAIEVALASKPDLFILDLMMPEPDGFRLCRLLRSFPIFATTPILIVTALNDQDSKAVAFGAGADDYLAKPFHIDELGLRVKKLVNKNKSL